MVSGWHSDLLRDELDVRIASAANRTDHSSEVFVTPLFENRFDAKQRRQRVLELFYAFIEHCLADPRCNLVCDAKLVILVPRCFSARDKRSIFVLDHGWNIHLIRSARSR
uniref:AlNc14C52G4069 protein n=1 Tax=Albugo laibachii Nc14 TaxID=890382 RepID=F0WBM4_9STRA|nr:AlNc14C52G4069 [Albugo laibachii Nc14]|eukprot:CCA18551.1 AlNc14C52G4069 [Albugo laibachii Nc14]